jgi:hypothetical protein
MYYQVVLFEAKIIIQLCAALVTRNILSLSALFRKHLLIIQNTQSLSNDHYNYKVLFPSFHYSKLYPKHNLKNCH